MSVTNIIPRQQSRMNAHQQEQWSTPFWILNLPERSIQIGFPDKSQLLTRGYQRMTILHKFGLQQIIKNETSNLNPAALPGANYIVGALAK
ncbi:hypothetical protein FGO68_gene7077 [Halteria grandinella]|uniref:Uncharacterized protein n=1 Tax=Halteria grandinella TaxID=5974 RepID=A0A8J8T0F0_HALGN|nr:hypothetical protein FGO68_gene7077 [Halteria grandinella]